MESINSTDVPNTPLPTLDRLDATIPPDLNVSQVAKSWFTAFSQALSLNNTQNISKLFILDGWWRDILSLSWDFRTFSGLSKINQFLVDRLHSMRPSAFKLREDASLGLHQPFPDLAWINLMFDFETEVGIASGIARLVPTANGDWKAHTVFTNLEALKGIQEQIGNLRNPSPNHGNWEENRKKASNFEDKPPTVLIIGGGQSGLDLAARLKALDVSALVIEKNERIGDNWRNRYDALCLHDPVWYDHMPYMPFPETWPVYSPARKFANWLAYYAEALELNIWLSSVVVSAVQDENTSNWTVIIRRGDGTERSFTVKHVVFATGIGSPDPTLPSYPGMDQFRGQLLHSLRHKRALDHEGKRVVVVGACTSAHDIAADYSQHGVDVTMYQRSSTYVMSCKNGWDTLFKGLYWEDGPSTDVADRLNASFPLHMSVGLAQRTTKFIAERDKDILQGLQKVGFQVNSGILGTGFGFLAWIKAGGYYLDTGASTLIAEGKIKLKSGSSIKEFTEDSIKFEDETEIPADVVVFATGLGDSKGHIRKVCGDEVADRCKPIWGLNREGEIYGAWRDLGVKGLWYMLGNLALCRFHSKHVALQIKAMEEGLFGERYSADE